MPEDEIKKRGGLVKVRTQKLPNGHYRHIYVVASDGPEGGRTIVGPLKKDKLPLPQKMKPASLRRKK